MAFAGNGPQRHWIQPLSLDSGLTHSKKLNGRAPLTGGTCYTDTTGNFSRDNTYFVRSVIDGIEQAASDSFTLPAHQTVEPCVVVPLGGGNTDEIHFVWVGDLDGDGEYEGRNNNSIFLSAKIHATLLIFWIGLLRKEFNLPPSITVPAEKYHYELNKK